MPNKKEFTQAVIQHLPSDQQPSLDWALKHWWLNIREGGGLRLTLEGFTVFKSLGLESWGFEIPPATPRVLMILDQRLTCPYFIKLGKEPKLIMFGSKEATLFGLYGDVKKFIRMLDLD